LPPLQNKTENHNAGAFAPISAQSIVKTLLDSGQAAFDPPPDIQAARS
jgi:hypothetical protein